MSTGDAFRNLKNIMAGCIILICVSIFGVNGYAANGVYSYYNGTWSSYETLPGKPVSISVGDNSIVLATTTGVYKYGTSWTEFGKPPGTPISISVYDDGSGYVVATTDGIYSYYSQSFTAYGLPPGTPVSVSTSDNVWLVATTQGIYQYYSEAWHLYATPPETPVSISMYESGNSFVLATEKDVYSYYAGEFTSLGKPLGTPISISLNMYGSMVVATTTGIYKYNYAYAYNHIGVPWTSYGTPPEMPVSISMGNDDSYWIATTTPIEYTMDEMITRINNNIAKPYIDILKFGTNNGNTLKWRYLGRNQDTSDTISNSGNAPYFVMMYDSYINIPAQRYTWSGLNWTNSTLYGWLNGTFKTTNLSNDSRILEVTLLSYDDYVKRINSTTADMTTTWWLRTKVNQSAAYSVSSSKIWASGIETTQGVRPAFYLNTDTTPPPAPTANPSGGTYNTSKSVTLSDTESGVTIRYTTNGTDPTISSTLYSSAITISSATTLKAKAWDAVGNASSTMTQTYTLDTTAPTVAITADKADTTNASSIIYTMQFSEAVTGFAINDITVSNGIKGTFTAVDGDTYTLVVTNSGSCSQTVSIGAGVCTDIAGNNNIAGSKAITVDRTPPTGTISYNPATATTGNVVATLTPSETVTVTNPSSGATTYTFSTNGSFTFAFKDDIGNIGSATATVSNIDRTAPTGRLTINSGNPAYTSSKRVTLYPSASDTGGSGVDQMCFRNYGASSWSSWTTYSTRGYAWTLVSGSGSKTVYVRYKDKAGNISSSYYDSITIATAATVTTEAVTNITQTTATGNGYITSLGVPNPTAYGFVWNTTGNPIISSNNNNLGATTSTGAYTAAITGLSAGTTYYVRTYATNAAGTVYGTQVSFTTLTAAPVVTRTVTSSGASSGKVRVQLSWPAVIGAANYRIWIFDGGSYRVHDIGNVTSWDSDAAKIYPTAAQLAAWNGTTDPFRWDGTGQSFAASWNPMYAKVPGGSYTTWSYYNWIHVAALNSAGNPSGSGPWQLGVTSVSGELYDTDAPNIPDVPAIGINTFDSVKLNVDEVTDKYMTVNYHGSGVKGYNFRNVTTGVESGLIGNSYTFTGLSSNTEYVFKVQAIDNNGNYSDNSWGIKVKTLGFITCDEYGEIRKGIDKSFTTATATIDDVDQSGNYSYYGIDIGIFKKPDIRKPARGQSNWPVIYLKRVPTDKLIIKITDFGDLNKYIKDEVYTIGYRILYTPINTALEDTITETAWRRANNGYFTLAAHKPMTHNQKIRYKYLEGNEIKEKIAIVSNPNEPNISNQDELNAYNGFKTFMDEDYVTYMLGFDLSNINNMDKLEITLNLNAKRDNGTNIDKATLKLIKDKIKLINTDSKTECDLSSMTILPAPTDEPIYSQNGNTYTIRIDKSSLKGEGYYNLEYTCKLDIKPLVNGGMDVLKNVGSVKLLDNSNKELEIIGLGGRDKNWVITNIYTKVINYR